MIESLRIASPCPTTWETMVGDDRVRHCAVCSLNVYNFAEMTREEIRALIARNEGRVCARLYRRADGTLLTRDCPTGLRALQRRASRAAAAMVAALLSFPAFAFGATTRKPNVEVTIEEAVTAEPGAFTGVVLFDDAPLPGVTVLLCNETTGREVSLATNANGVFAFTALSEGTYRVDLLLAGYKPATIQRLDLQSGVATHASVRMEPAVLDTITVGRVMADGRSH